MMKYAIPSVAALVVNALYNIVDQIFIGLGVGTLGNSATNVIFPLNMVVTARTLLFGDGGAAEKNQRDGGNLPLHMSAAFIRIGLNQRSFFRAR